MRRKLSDYNSLLITHYKRNTKLSTPELAVKLKERYPKRFGQFKPDSIRRQLDFIKSIVDCKSYREIQKEKLTTEIERVKNLFPDETYISMATKVKLKFKDYSVSQLKKLVSNYCQFGDIYYG